MIRLARVGATKQPHYRVVVIEKDRARNGRSIEVVGTYNPRSTPAHVDLKRERIAYWTGNGAQLSDRVEKLLNAAPAAPAVAAVAAAKPAATPAQAKPTETAPAEPAAVETAPAATASVEAVATSDAIPAAPEAQPATESVSENAV